MAFDILVAAALFAQTASGAHAQLVSAANPQSVANALASEGYAAKLATDSEGDPMITSQSSGSTFSVFFYNCDKGRNCATVQFYAGYDVQEPPSLERINAWNREYRFGRAYIDDSNDPVIEMDVDLDDGGMSRELFVDNLQFWTSIMADFEKHIGW